MKIESCRIMPVIHEENRIKVVFEFTSFSLFWQDIAAHPGSG